MWVLVELANHDSYLYEVDRDTAQQVLYEWINGERTLSLGKFGMSTLTSEGHIWVKELRFSKTNDFRD